MRAHRLVAIAALVVASGCVTSRKMALSKDPAQSAVDPKESVALMAVKVTNVFKTSYQPHVTAVWVSTVGGENTRRTAFEAGEAYRKSEDEANQFEEFLVSFALEPGEYLLEGVWVKAGGGLVFGNGIVPVNHTFKVTAGQTIYLGRVEAVRRERVKDEEERAGSLMPLIDQSVTGMSGGTFDVKLFDGYDHDLPLMRAEYPTLKDMKVEKAFMKPKAAPTPPAALPAPLAPLAQ